MMLNPADDPQTVADYRLCDLEDAITVLAQTPGEDLAAFAERIADRADDLMKLTHNAPRRPE